MNCSKEDNSNSEISTSSNSSVSDQNNSSSTSSNSSGSNQENSSSTVVNSDFECDNWFYNLPRPAPVSEDNTHRYYEYSWQSDPMLCLNAYEPSILGDRVDSVKDFLHWAKKICPT